jgi:outer membrane lipoprotein-sorting protein
MKSLSTLAIALLLSAFSAQAITVDEILKNYFDNTGGLALWQKIETMKMSGNVPTPQGDFSFVVMSKSPNKTRIEVDIQGTQMIPQCYNGEMAWTLNPFAGGKTAAKMTDEETKELAEEAIFESEYIDYKKKGHEITLEGKEVIDGVDCYKLKVHKNVGNDMEESVEYHFFDTENFVPIMIRTTIKVGPGKGGPAEEYLSDYQETEYGIIMPYYFETKMEGQVVNQIVVEKVDINVDIEDSIFEMPAAE